MFFQSKTSLFFKTISRAVSPFAFVAVLSTPCFKSQRIALMLNASAATTIGGSPSSFFTLMSAPMLNNRSSLFSILSLTSHAEATGETVKSVLLCLKRNCKTRSCFAAKLTGVNPLSVFASNCSRECFQTSRIAPISPA